MKFFIVLSSLLIFSCAKSIDSPLAGSLPRLPALVSVVFSGDFMQHYPQITAATSADTFNYDTQLRYIAPLWRSADFAIINLETTLTTDSARYSGYPLFAAPTAIAPALARAGITHAALANNHCVDKGARGVHETLGALRGAKIGYTGMWEKSSEVNILILEKDSVKIAILNYTYGTNGNIVPENVVVNLIDTAAIAVDILRAKAAGATNVVVFYHWGDEYIRSASSSQQALAMWSKARGADAVIGSHPHVVQGIDIKNRVVYSLGNFVSNQSKIHTDAGISVRLTFCRGVAQPRIEYLPHSVDLKSAGAEKYTITPPAHAADLNAINLVRDIVRNKTRQ